jgi:hypothetical protein
MASAAKKVSAILGSFRRDYFGNQSLFFQWASTELR